MNLPNALWRSGRTSKCCLCRPSATRFWKRTPGTLLLLGSLVQCFHRLDPVAGIPFAIQLLQAQQRSVVHLDVGGGSFRILHGDVFEERNKLHAVNLLLVILHVAVALGGSHVIVEGSAGR